MKKFKKIWNNNGGYTLIELLAVVGLLALLAGIYSFSLGLTPSTQAKETTQNINSLISRTKSGSLTKTGSVYMKITMDDKNQVRLEYYEDGALKEWDIVSTSDQVQVGYFTTSSTGTNYTIITKSNPLYLAFDRRSTGFVTIEEAAKLDGVNGRENAKCNEIVVWGGTKDANVAEYSVEISPTTGSHFLRGLG